MHILLIDDFLPEHRKWRRVLRGMPVKLSSVMTYAEAEQMLQADGQSIDAIILDIRLDAGTGFDLVPRIRACCPGARVLVSSAYLDPEAQVRAQKLGLQLVSKDKTVRTLREALSLITSTDSLKLRALIPDLTEREVETIEQWIAHGGDSQATATAMGISEKTLKTHWANITKKAGLTRRQILCILAQRPA